MKKELSRYERRASGSTLVRVSKATHELIMQLHKRKLDEARDGWWTTRQSVTVDDVLYQLAAAALQPKPLTTSAIDKSLTAPRGKSVNGRARGRGRST